LSVDHPLPTVEDYCDYEGIFTLVQSIINGKVDTTKTWFHDKTWIFCLCGDKIFNVSNYIDYFF